jgi:hypothetical protein
MKIGFFENANEISELEIGEYTDIIANNVIKRAIGCEKIAGKKLKNGSLQLYKPLDVHIIKFSSLIWPIF